MATGSSSGTVLPSTSDLRKQPGVFTFAFLGAKAYAVTSYPHPIQGSEENQPRHARELVLQNAPSTLVKRIKTLTEIELTKPDDSIRRFSLKLGCYVMHIFCWRPRAFNASSTLKDSDKSLLLVYSWNRNASDKWYNDPAVGSENAAGGRDVQHPELRDYVLDIREEADGGHNFSHVALDETSNAFFIRVSDNARSWLYRHRGLPKECELAIQSAMTAKSSGLTNGRLRAVTLGQGGGWILYREENYKVSWGGDLLPALKKILKEGQRKELVINQAVLNPHHPLEYVLAYNDGTVYYSFHESFQNDFDRIAEQWCDRKGVVFVGHFTPLDDSHYDPPAHEIGNPEVKPKELPTRSEENKTQKPEAKSSSFAPGWNHHHPDGQPRPKRHERKSTMERVKTFMGIDGKEELKGNANHNAEK